MQSYPSDATGLFSTATFTSMVDRKPDRGYSSELEFNTIIFESESGYEKRRLRSRRPKRTFDLTYTNIDGLMLSAINNFYRAQSGTYQSFYFDLTHINETGTIITRFDSPIKVNHVLSAGSNVLENYYSVSFTLKEIYD